MQRNYRFNTELYCITAEELSMGRSNVEVVKEMIAAGVKIIQYREKDKKMKVKYSECCIIRELTKKAGVTFIVNDDIDLAIIVQADGVHIGQDDLPIEKVRELVGEQMIIGISTHCPEEAQQAVQAGADYIGVGPIFKTATKKDVCAPVGFEYLDYVAKNIPIPFVAIGGIKLNNIPEVIKSGAQCVAIITEITTAGDIPERISQIREVIKNSIVEEK
ncbi:thiamine phosphate synthase [Pelosinus sp. sgz500959]|uniref:thiamine phosphate synthase n=1 Tax=Pelosinus sp. sgz500959 TaxID=3242472 RepID=UPI00366C574B